MTHRDTFHDPSGPPLPPGEDFGPDTGDNPAGPPEAAPAPEQDGARAIEASLRTVLAAVRKMPPQPMFRPNLIEMLVDASIACLHYAPARSMVTSPDTSDGYHTFRELYAHRHALFLLLLCWAPPQAAPWWSRKHDRDQESTGLGCMFPGYVIAGLETPCGQITYHLPESYADALAAIPGVKEYGYAPRWDGHSANDVVQRLLDTVRDASEADL
jgi:hypothetical protein